MTRHRLDAFALGAGVFFLALAVGYLLDGLDVWDMDGAWAAPALCIAFGVAGVLWIIDHRDASVAPTDRSATEPSEPG